jgi:hypothetical protein
VSRAARIVDVAAASPFVDADPADWDRVIAIPESSTRDFEAKWFVERVNPETNVAERVRYALMSYTGSIAGDHMIEVAKDGDPSKGSWVVRPR